MSLREEAEEIADQYKLNNKLKEMVKLVESLDSHNWWISGIEKDIKDLEKEDK